MSTRPGPANPAISLSTAPEPYVDVKRAASYLSVAGKTLNEWARLEKIPVDPWGDGNRNASLANKRVRFDYGKTNPPDDVCVTGRAMEGAGNSFSVAIPAFTATVVVIPKGQ